MTTIEPMTAELKPATMKVIRRMHELSPVFSPVSFDEDVVGAYYDACINRPDLAFGRLVVDDRKHVLGFLAGSLQPMLFNQRMIASDWGLFVLDGIPNRAKFALQLVNEFKAWAIERGAAMVWMGVTVGISDDGAGALLRHCGFKRQGSYYTAKGMD